MGLNADKFNLRKVRASGIALVVLVALALVLEAASFAVGYMAGQEGSSQPTGQASLSADEAAADEASASAAIARDIAAEREVRERARSLGGLHIDSLVVTQAQARNIVASGSDFAGKVEFIDQRPILPAGCELIALTAALRSMGFSLTETEIADNYVDYGWDEATSYVGSPYIDGGGLPPSIVFAANAWLDENGGSSSAVAHDLTGSDFESLCMLVEAGIPVLVWTTEGLGMPEVDYFTEKGPAWYWPEHCVVLCGVDGDEVLVADSLEGLVARGRAWFAEVYVACGSMAVAVLPA